MMIRWLLACSLALCCSFAISCSWRETETDDGPKAAATDETQTSKDAKRNLAEVKTSLESVRTSIKNVQQQVPTATAIAKQSQNTNQRTERNVAPSPSPAVAAEDDAITAKPLQKAITGAIDELTALNSQVGHLETVLAGQPETQESHKSIQAVGKSVAEAVRKLDDASDALADIEEKPTEQRTRLNESLKEALDLVESKALQAINNIKIPNDLKATSSWLVGLMDIGIWVGIILASILGLLLLIAAGRALIKSSATRADARIKSKIQPLASSMQKQQAEVASQIAALTTSQNDLRTRVSDLEFEIKRVARVARNTANDGAGRRPPAPASAFSAFEEPVERNEPAFPISIGDYLSKMQRSSNIVRPDFQNDILVSDPGGTGELVLIRDAAIPDDLQPLFVVPRATQFQTKQDFYTYYQKYYECARPSAGDVWIIDPAVVSKVSGGWQLREKGVLEVR